MQPTAIIRRAWGRLVLAYRRIKFMAELSLTNAAIASLNTAADNLIAALNAHSGDAATIAQLQAELAQVDQQAASQIQPVIDKITAATPTG